MWQQQVFLHKVSVESFDIGDRYNASEMATKEPESQLLERGSSDPLQLGDGEAPAGETALRIQGQVLPQRRGQVRAGQGAEVVQLVWPQHHTELQIRDGALT